MTSTAGRAYARALFELARERGAAGAAAAAGPQQSIDRVGEELRVAREALFDDPEVRAFLSHRLISRATKKRMVRSAFEGTADEHLRVLLALLVDRGRTLLLGEIEEEYARLARLARGVRKVTLTSAFPLGGAEASRVTRALEARFAARVELEVQVRPGLIGGVVATSEGQEIELSIEGRLRDLAGRLRGAEPSTRDKADSGPAGARDRG